MRSSWRPSIARSTTRMWCWILFATVAWYARLVLGVCVMCARLLTFVCVCVCFRSLGTQRDGSAKVHAAAVVRRHRQTPDDIQTVFGQTGGRGQHHAREGDGHAGADDGHSQQSVRGRQELPAQGGRLALLQLAGIQRAAATGAHQGHGRAAGMRKNA